MTRTQSGTIAIGFLKARATSSFCVSLSAPALALPPFRTVNGQNPSCFWEPCLSADETTPGKPWPIIARL